MTLSNYPPNEGLVKLVWLDTTFTDADQTAEEALNQSPSQMITVGFLLEDTDSNVIVASTMMEDCYRAVICVPKGCVVSLEKLRRSKRLS